MGECSRLGRWRLGGHIIVGTADGKPIKGKSKDDEKMNMFTHANNN
jgi:hypothetical protein